uniref:Chromosome partitioning protein ParA n=1 Tax=Candidatus Berkiella aquae TaxID=295108 RepID=A0A0Q9Z0J8_9GAMM
MRNQILAFANQKGGVGKTTSCVNLAASLVLSKQRVLLCDLDPQGNATMGSGVDKSAVDFSMNDLLQGKATVKQAIIEQTPAGYDVIPANSDLTAAEVVLVKKQAHPIILSKALAAVKDQYDYIFLDCPPSLSMLTLNALVAADAVMIAMQCEYYALEGLSDLINTIKQLRGSVNPRLEVGGIIRTMYDGRNRLAAEVSSQLIDHFGNKVFQTALPIYIRLAEAPSYGLPVQLYDKHSRGSAAYLALAAEFLRRQRSGKKDKPVAKRELIK